MESLDVILKEVEDLRRDLSAERVIEKEVSHYERRYVDEYENWTEYVFGTIDYVKVVDEPEIRESDVEKIRSARTELTQMAKSHESGMIRYAASKALGKKAESLYGYYPLRIWTNQHPVAATITGLATAGAASGLVYVLAEYFNR